MKLFNTLSREKEEISQKKLSLYTCGPTVYNYAHIGNLRTYIFEDLLKRTLIFLGHKVKHVMNITDVDDKTIKGAIDRDLPLIEYTEPYVKAFLEDIKTLSIMPADHYPKATDYIEEMITVIERLIKEGAAYVGKDHSVYFSLKAYPPYGKLSHLKLDELKTNASDRLNLDEYDKENASDFVLWKSYQPERDGKIYWESPFGKGRPGWHIECSTMAIKLLGETIDVHCGGVDNIFPHHENEIAQSECFTCKPFVKHWAHAEHLIVEGKKMSKSLGNFYTLRDLLNKGYSPSEIRYMLLQTHYRTQLNFTFEGLEAARASLARLSDFLFRLTHAEGKGTKKILYETDDLLEAFKSALSDDLNISKALSHLFDYIRTANRLIDEGLVSKSEAEEALKGLYRIDQVLEFLPFKKDDVPKAIEEALERRELARKEKDWAEADRLRDFIHSSGYIIEDTPKGARAKKQN